MYKIEIYSPQYKEGVAELLQNLWQGDAESNYIRFESKYEMNPYDDSIYAVVALYENRIVGFRGFIPTKWTLSGSDKWLLLVADACVHPDHRRKGLFEKMTQRAIDVYQESKFMGYLNLSSNRFSTPGYLKLGWQPFDQKSFHRFTSLYSLLSFSLKRPLRGEVKNKSIKIEDRLCDSDFADIKNLTNASDKLTLCDKKEFYQFKLLRQKAYRFIKYYSSDNTLSAYATISIKGSTCTIVDFGYNDIKYLRQIIRELRRLFYIVSVWDVSIKGLGIRSTLLSEMLRKTENKKKEAILFRPIEAKLSVEAPLSDELLKMITTHLELRSIYAE